MNLDVPDDLLAAWIYNPRDDDPAPSGFYLSVFTFGFIQQEMLTRKLAAGQKCSIAASRIVRCFDYWQMKLGLVEIERRTDVTVAPLPLFAFPDGEQITYSLKGQPS